MLSPRKLAIVVILFLVCVSCTQKSKVITNQRGGYSIQVLPDWISSTENATTTLMKSKSLIVEATLYVTTEESEFKTLEESFNAYVAELSPSFVDYESLGNGNTQINNMPAMWHRMRDTENGKRFHTILYLMQPKEKELILISCSSLTDTFSDYEEDFTKMCFSLKRLRE